jgi:tetratricopeptide (TPR) repeat protein
MKSGFAAAFLASFFLLSVPASAQFREHHDLRGSLSGRVVSAMGDRGVAGARVQIRPLMGGQFDETETNWNGEFSFPGLSTGRYVVCVKSAGANNFEQDVQVDETNYPMVIRLAGPAAPAKEGSATVSVHELRIPGKARKAFEKGLERQAKKDAAGSIAEFERAIAAYPSYYEAYFKLGTAQLDLGRGSEATEAFRKAIELSEGHYAMAYFALGMVLCNGNNFAEAETLARTGLSLDPASTAGAFALAWAEFGLNRLADAERDTQDLLRRRPDFPEARLLMAEIHRRENNLPALVEDLDGYLKLDGTSPKSAQLRALRDDVARSLMPAEKKPAVIASVKP